VIPKEELQRDGGVAQAAENLPCKLEALNANPGQKQTNKQTNKTRRGAGDRVHWKSLCLAGARP
jgi:hypothetical protein